MFESIKTTWNRLKKHEPGERFGAFYREQKDKPPWVKVAFICLAVLSFAAGVVFAFIPGPAVLFFALSGALVSTQSRRFAQWLDKAEVWGRRAFASARTWWRHKRGRGGPPKTRHA
jgi:hypothetical protein